MKWCPSILATAIPYVCATVKQIIQDICLPLPCSYVKTVPAIFVSKSQICTILDQHSDDIKIAFCTRQH